MQIAARNGNLEIMKLLYEQGASVRTRGLSGDTLFHLAAAYGYVDVLKWLSLVGADIRAVDVRGQTACHIAARRCELEALHFMHESLFMSMIDEDSEGVLPIDLVPRKGKSSSVLEGGCAVVSMERVHDTWSYLNAVMMK